MPKNQIVVDWKPRNEAVLDYKPKNENVIDWKPKNFSALNSLETNQLYEVVISAGQSLGPGFFMYLTYPTTITVLNPET